MIGGLQAGSPLTEDMASAICLHVNKERVKGELLASAYSRIYEVNKPTMDIKALRKQRKLKKKSSRLTVTLTRGSRWRTKGCVDQNLRLLRR